MISVLTDNKGLIVGNVLIEEVIKVIKGETPSKNTEKVKQIRALIEENRIEESKLLKRSLAAVTYNASFDRRRVKDNLVSYSGYIYLDFDNIEVEYYLDMLKSFSFIYAIFKSVSGKGLSALVRTEEIKTEGEFDATVASIHNDIEALGLDLDKGCKDSTRMTYLSYDKDIYLDELCLSYPTSEPVEQVQIDFNFTPIVTTNPSEALDIAYNTACKKHGMYQVGNRNNWLMSFGGVCISLGIPEHEALSYATAFATYKEVKRIEDAYRRYGSSFGQFNTPQLKRF